MAKGSGSGKTPAILVEYINKAIAEKGQKTFELEVGLSTSMISRYKRGIGEPTAATLQKFADYFGVSVSALQGINVFDNLPVVYNFTDRFLITADYYFNETIKHIDSLDESFEIWYLGVVFSMARIVIDMPEEMCSQAKHADLPTVKEKAVKVIEVCAAFFTGLGDLFPEYLAYKRDMFLKERGYSDSVVTENGDG